MECVYGGWLELSNLHHSAVVLVISHVQQDFRNAGLSVR